MKYPNTEILLNMPYNYRTLRRLEWIRIALPGIVGGPDRVVWSWLGENVSGLWSYRDNLQGARSYYFENDKDAMLFTLRWL